MDQNSQSVSGNEDVIYEAKSNKTSHNNATNLTSFNIPSFTIEHIESLRTENTVLKEKLLNHLLTTQILGFNNQYRRYSTQPNRARIN
jgi:hypothetical protein